MGKGILEETQKKGTGEKAKHMEQHGNGIYYDFLESPLATCENSLTSAKCACQMAVYLLLERSIHLQIDAYIDIYISRGLIIKA